MRKFNSYLVGYYGMKNSGDDALMTAAIIGIKKRNNDARILVSTPSSLRLYDGSSVNPSLAESQLFRGQNRLQHYMNSSRSNSIVFGGGSVLHNSHDLRIKLQMLKLAGTRDSRAVGVSVGPFVDAQAEKYCAELLNKLDFVGLRDEKSFQIAKEISPNANLHLTFDLAPSLMASHQFAVAQTNREGILVNICPVAKTPNGNFDIKEDSFRVESLAKALTKIAKTTGESVSIMSLNSHLEFGDDDLCQALYRRLNGVIPVKVINYHHNVFNVIKVVSSFKVCLSMRLHGNVFAYMTNTPSISLNYHVKCNQWCNQIGLSKKQRFDLHELSSTALSDTVIDGLETGFEKPSLELNDALDKSLSNWR